MKNVGQWADEDLERAGGAQGRVERARSWAMHMAWTGVYGMGELSLVELGLDRGDSCLVDALGCFKGDHWDGSHSPAMTEWIKKR